MLGEKWSYLWSVTQEIEADIIIGLLNEERIPGTKQYPEPAGFLKKAYGLSTGVDIYVPTDLREVALQLIQDSLSVALTNEDEFEEENIKMAETVRYASAPASLQTSYVNRLIILLALLIITSALVYYSHILR